MIERYTLDTGYRCTNAGSLTTTRDGRVLWLTGGPDFGNEAPWLMRRELRESRDSGRTWGPPRIVPGQGFGGVVTQLASGRLLNISIHFVNYSSDDDPDQSLCEGYTQISVDGGGTWTEPQRLPCAERYIDLSSPAIQLLTGRVIFPFGYLTKLARGKSLVSAVYSDDEGATWQRSPSALDVGGSGFESGGSEPAVVELADGRVWMIIRAQTGFLWESFSSDGGATWEAARPSRLPSSSSAGLLLRRSNGQIVLVWNNSVWRSNARESLMAAYTEDGQTFQGFREIMHTDYPMASGPEEAGYWYATNPTVCEAPDKTILVAVNYGNWSCCTARLVRFDTEWLEASSMFDDFRDGRGAWQYLGAAVGRLMSPEDDGPGASFELAHNARFPSVAMRSFPLVSHGWMSATLTVIRPDVHLIWHNSYFKPGEYREACLRVRFDGESAFVAVGRPEIRDIAGSNPRYSYLAYPLSQEVKYPRSIETGKRFTVKVQCDFSKKEAQVSIMIDDGPIVELLGIPVIAGYCYFGAGADKGGAFRLRCVASSNDPNRAIR